MIDMPKATQVTKTTVEINLDPESVELLNKLYGLIWIEACIDPFSDATQEFALKCLPMIKRLNQMWRFKK